MPDTHINAYFSDVDEAQKKFEQAAGELQAARERLETKKKQVGYVDPVVEKQSVEEDPKPVNTFGKKK